MVSVQVNMEQPVTVPCKRKRRMQILQLNSKLLCQIFADGRLRYRARITLRSCKKSCAGGRNPRRKCLWGKNRIPVSRKQTKPRSSWPRSARRKRPRKPTKPRSLWPRSAPRKMPRKPTKAAVAPRSAAIQQLVQGRRKVPRSSWPRSAPRKRPLLLPRPAPGGATPGPPEGGG